MKPMKKGLNVVVWLMYLLVQSLDAALVPGQSEQIKNTIIKVAPNDVQAGCYVELPPAVVDASEVLKDMLGDIGDDSENTIIPLPMSLGTLGKIINFFEEGEYWITSNKEWYDLLYAASYLNLAELLDQSLDGCAKACSNIVTLVKFKMDDRSHFANNPDYVLSKDLDHVVATKIVSKYKIDGWVMDLMPEYVQMLTIKQVLFLKLMKDAFDQGSALDLRNDNNFYLNDIFGSFPITVVATIVTRKQILGFLP